MYKRRTDLESVGREDFPEETVFVLSAKWYRVLNMNSVEMGGGIWIRRFQRVTSAEHPGWSG